MDTTAVTTPALTGASTRRDAVALVALGTILGVTWASSPARLDDRVAISGKTAEGPSN